MLPGIDHPAQAAARNRAAAGWRRGFAGLASVLLLAAHEPAAARDDGPPAPSCEARTSPAPESFAGVVLRNADAVVRVISVRYSRVDMADPDDRADADRPLVPLAGQGGKAAPTWFAERSLASGFVIGADGQIVTSAHALRNAQETWVALRDGRQLRAHVLGVDHALDLALLKIEPGGRLPTVETAARELVPGEWVAAIGAPFGFEESVTAGVVSANPRQIAGEVEMTVVQTDVATNPGSSGGPLMNACGQVAGMSSMIFSAAGIYVGVSFAVPIRPLMRAVQRLRTGSPGVQVGLQTQSLSPALARAFQLPGRDGVVVVHVEPGRAAEQAGLHEGDIILALAGRPIGSGAAWREAEDALVPQVPVAVDLWREGAQLRVVLRPQAVTTPTAAAEPQKAASLSRLGMRLSLGTPVAGSAQPGVYVLAVAGRALAAGIEEGDRIAALNAQPVRSLPDFDRVLERAIASQAAVAALLIVREGVPLYVPVHLKDD
ncbi:MAG: trypsin-like peptidase domain-containing protein [Ramlibacter sp.]